MENCLNYDAIHDFSLWLRTSSNAVDINRIRSQMEIKFIPSYQIFYAWKLVELRETEKHFKLLKDVNLNY